MQCMILAITNVPIQIPVSHILEITERRRQFKTQKIGPSYLDKPLIYCRGFIVRPCRVGSVGSVSASRTVGREFASRPGHTKDHYKNGTNCLPA